jgi:hypothetical protein
MHVHTAESAFSVWPGTAEREKYKAVVRDV